MELLGSIPTTWDTTIIVEAKVANYIITARRKGEDWFIGGMTDWTARTFNLQLSFLSSGNYEATLCKDGVNADRYAADYSIKTFPVKKDDFIPVQMSPGGGFLIWLKKK
jgi:alpha-glucosidase